VNAVPAARTPAHLVVRLPNPAGDVVLSTPVLRALRAALPESRITWAGRPAGLALLDGLLERDDVFPLVGPFAGGGLAPWRTGRAWRRLGADAVLCLPNSWSSALAARASGAAVRVGYARRGRGFLLTHRLLQPRDADDRLHPEPMGERYLRLAAVFGAVSDGRPARLSTTPEGERLAEARLRRAGRAGPFVAASPGAAFGPSKVYPPRLLAEAVARIASESGLTPLVLCGPGEEALAADVARRLPAGTVSTHDDPARWPETKSLLSRCALLVTPDAGPRHVAAALGVPAVVVMGPTHPGWTRGDEHVVTVVRREDLPCLACHRKRCPVPGHPCMETLDPAEVARAGTLRLARRPAGPG
jgi:heptosyltransferase-2